MSQPLFRRLPSVQELLDSPPLRQLVQTVHRTSVTTGVQQFLDKMRDELRSATAELPTPTDLADRIAKWIAAQESSPAAPVINATGVLLAAELAGPLLAEEAYRAVQFAARERVLEAGGATAVERRIERKLCQLTGAEAAAIFPDGPGALLTLLSSLARGSDVLVARSQIVEVGGMALPEIVAASRARLREVGTTNRATIDDFAPFANAEAGLVLQFAPAQFDFLGEHSQPSLADLAAFARSHRLPLAAHLGIGGLVDLPTGAADVPSASRALQAGVDLCVVQGDGLTGGPACQLVLGKRELVERLVEEPLRAALHADRYTLAALEATLDLYLAQPVAWSSIPLAGLLAAPLENLKNRAERVAAQWSALAAVESATAVESVASLTPSGVRGGSLASWSVVVRPRRLSVVEIDARLRRQSPAVVATLVRDTTAGDTLRFDLRGVLPRQDVDLVDAVEEALAEGTRTASESET